MCRKLISMSQKFRIILDYIEMSTYSIDPNLNLYINYSEMVKKIDGYFETIGVSLKKEMDKTNHRELFLKSFYPNAIIFNELYYDIFKYIQMCKNV